ncbi:hypothetical protein FXB41_07140 [Bradyrhizobium canariense]|uniref:hypothetical protein n=1 Tax=Bradyrhizobium canariense TaxID=255045 RepID=UPI001CA5C470|nr:hypothetical protein [Bradyrhizobium canariense]MBW5434559.1 hypothetical protein [Bradyrhizobium canariense]
MSERALTPYARAGRLLSLARDLHQFCEQHQLRDLAGGMTYDEVHQVERQLAEATQWVRHLGAGRAPNGRAAEPVPAERVPVDDECF